MAEYPRPANGWGQAAANNTNGFGQGAGNATNGWGTIHALTPPNPATDFVGVPDIPSVTYGLDFVAASLGYVEFDSIIFNPVDWFIRFKAENSLNGSVVGYTNASNRILLRTDGTTRVYSGSTTYSNLTYIRNAAKFYTVKQNTGGAVFELYESDSSEDLGSLVDTAAIGANTAGIILLYIARTQSSYSNIDVYHLNINDTHKYWFDEGSGTTLGDSIGTNNGTIFNAAWI